MSSRTPETIGQDFSAAEARISPIITGDLLSDHYVEGITGVSRRDFLKAGLSLAVATAAACATPPRAEIIASSTPIPTHIVPTPDNPLPTPTPIPTVRPEASATPNRPGGVNDPEVIENALIQPWPTLTEFPQVISAGGPLIIPVESNIRAQYEAVNALIKGSNYDATHKFNPVNDQNAVKNPWDVYLAVYDNAQPGDKARWAVAGITQEGFVLPVDSQGSFMDRPDYTVLDDNKTPVAGFALLKAPDVGRTDIHFGWENANDHWTPVVRTLDGQILASWNFTTKDWQVSEIAKPKEGFDPNRLFVFIGSFAPEIFDLRSDTLPPSLAKWGFASVEDLKSTLWTREVFAQQASDQLGILDLQSSLLGRTSEPPQEVPQPVIALRLIKKGTVDQLAFGNLTHFDGILVQGVGPYGIFVADWDLLGYSSVKDNIQIPCFEWDTDSSVSVNQRISRLTSQYPPEEPLCELYKLSTLYESNSRNLMFVVSIAGNINLTTEGASANKYFLDTLNPEIDKFSIIPQNYVLGFVGIRIALSSNVYQSVVLQGK